MDAAGSNSIKLLLVDDHAVVREGLRRFLELQPDLEVVGEGENGRDAVRLSGELRPDVVLMDLVMPVMDGISAIRTIRKECPSVRVLALTSFTDQDKVIPAIESGVHGYLLKDVRPQELASAIRTVYAGKLYLDPAVTRHVVAHATSSKETSAVGIDELTPREREVLELIAQGKSNLQIADTLVITEKTVKSHVSRILSKLGVSDRTQAALYALKHGLVSLDRLDL